MRKKILNSRLVNHTRRQFKIKLEEFKNNISSFGSDINNWPSHIRGDALRTIEASSEARALLEEEGKFEEFLNLRTFEEASPELESRIISQADPRVSPTVKTGLYEYMSEFFSFFNFQKPAFALVIVLVLGITIGYLYDNYNDINANAIELNDFLYYEGEFYE